MMTLDDTYFMKQALIEAGKAAERGEVPVGAVTFRPRKDMGGGIKILFRYFDFL